MSRSEWYDSRWGRILYWGILGATLIGVVVSMVGVSIEMRIPVVVYLFGFLGATVYAFTSFANRFDQDGRYRLKILSRSVAVFPLVAGVYLLGFAFPGVSGEVSALSATPSGSAEVTGADRLLGGIVFLAGIYVSATLRVLGGLAERLLGEPASSRQESRGRESAVVSGTVETED